MRALRGKRHFCRVFCYGQTCVQDFRQNLGFISCAYVYFVDSGALVFFVGISFFSSLDFKCTSHFHQKVRCWIFIFPSCDIDVGSRRARVVIFGNAISSERPFLQSTVYVRCSPLAYTALQLPVAFVRPILSP